VIVRFAGARDDAPVALIRIQLLWHARKAIIVKSDSGSIDDNEAYPSMILDLDKCGDRSTTPEEAFESITVALRASGSAAWSDRIQYSLAPHR
jgi:hypothetical protein